ncbi:hypothetical protein [Mycobacterium marinum]|uniref:hypothetical protein n=1 Tax=Mycobacterium marinum TaxID=1781 RepID=UPI003567CC4D
MDPLNCHIAAVDTLAAAGIKPPAGWLALRDRFHAFTAAEHPCTDLLATEIVSPTGADVNVLRGAALAEWFPTTEADVRGAVARAVHAEMLRLYQPVAARHYRALATQFDEAATKFSKAARTADPELSPNRVVYDLDEAGRQSWLAAAVLAAELDSLLAPLAAAATLAGAPAEVNTPTDGAEGYRIALATDPGKLHRRRVWESWGAAGRCGRWSALHKLGASIRACSKPERLQPYELPKPYLVKVVPGKYGGEDRQYVDPHDFDHQPGTALERELAATTDWSA